MEQRSLVRIAFNGRVETADVATALDSVLSAWSERGSACLVGRDALQWVEEKCALRIRRLAARTGSGRKVCFDDLVVPLPGVPHGERVPIRLGFTWDPLPVNDGSSVLCGRCRAVLLEPGEAGEDGELTIGTLNGEGFMGVPVPADRLDGAAANLAWWMSSQELLQELDGLLVSLVSQLDRDSCPKLLWMLLLCDAVRELGAARAVREDCGTKETLERLDRCAAAIRAIPDRALGSRDPHLIELWSHSMGAEPVGGRDRHESALNALRAVRASLEGILSAVGIGIERLPVSLYRGGRLYRRARFVNFELESSDSVSSIYRIRDGCHRRAFMAALWKAGQPTSLGDVHTYHRDPAGPRREDCYHEGISGTGHHWFGEVVPATLRVSASSTLHLIEAAVYEPVAT